MTGYWTETPERLYGESREEWIAERAAIREYMGGQDRAAAERAAVSDWELWCAERKLDVETGMPLGETNAQASTQARREPLPVRELRRVFQQHFRLR